MKAKKPNAELVWKQLEERFTIWNGSGLVIADAAGQPRLFRHPVPTWASVLAHDNFCSSAKITSRLTWDFLRCGDYAPILDKISHSSIEPRARGRVAHP
jgi:hypothetical protein